MSKIQSGCQLSLIGQSIYRTSVFCNNNISCVIYDGKNYLWRVHLATQNIEAKINWGQISEGRKVLVINCMCHSQKFSYYFVFSDDWHIFILSSAFKFLKRVLMELKFISHAIFLDHLSSFMIVSTDTVSKFHINFVKDAKVSVGFNQQAFHLEVQEYKQLKDSLDWNKHCVISYDPLKISISYCIVYNSHSLVIYHLDQLTTVTQIKNITNTISCATYSLDYNYAIVGHLAGPISFYRVTSTIIPTLPTHTFQGHQRSINSLLIHPKKNYLLFSASLDATIKIWNIDTFTALFSYPLNVEQFEYVDLLNVNYFVLQQEENIYLGQLIHLLEYLYLHNSTVKFYDKSLSLHQRPSEGDLLERIQIAFQNNIIVSINSKEIENHIPNDPNKNYVKQVRLINYHFSIFFAPPISQSIKSIHSSPFEHNKYYMHFESGEICEWKISDGKTLIESISSFKDIISTQGYPANQQVSVIKFLDIIPSFFDVESKLWEGDIQKIKNTFNIEEDQIKTLGLKKTPEQFRVLNDQLRLLTLGCKKGSIIFVSLKKFHLVFSRINFHKEEIYEMGVITTKQGDKYLLSFSYDNFMKMVTFDNQLQKPEAVKSVQLNQGLTLLCYTEEYLVIALSQSIIFFECDAKNELITKITNSLNDHSSKIITIDLEKTKKLLLTCSSEAVKIFTLKAVCLLTITLDLPMDMACFGNCNGDILISLDGILCITRNIHPSEAEETIQEGVTLKIEEYFSPNFGSILKSKEDKYFQRQSLRRPQMRKNSLIIQQEAHEIELKNMKSHISTSVNKEVQTIKYFEVQKSTIKQTQEDKIMNFILPAIPKNSHRPVQAPLIQQYISDRKKKGPVKNRREWTMDKIILRNLAMMEQIDRNKLQQKNEF